jgi:hypothetical protein
MNKTLLRSLLLGACCAAPIAAVAGGVEVAPCCQPPRVDIPDMRAGWGFYLEGAAIQAYNNNLSYGFVEIVPAVIPTVVGEFKIPNVTPKWNFAIRGGVDYTLADSANVLKLDYEHVFDSNATDNTEIDVLGFVHGGEVKIKLDGVRLVSEQHILIGPYWEATLTGGLRYAHVQQTYERAIASGVFGDDDDLEGSATFFGDSHEVKFNGVGPLGGFGGMFHLTENLALGGETQIALLLGRNTNSIGLEYAVDGVVISEGGVDVSETTSLVPELFARIYGNYFYRFTDGMELQVELGWRLNQFFNVRDAIANDFFDVTHVSDDIGFSGPYLSAHLKI